MITLPSTFELASLAATQAGTPTQRAAAALALWHACAEELAQAANLQAAAAAEDARRAEHTAALPEDAEAVGVDAFIRAAMPQSKAEDRMRKFRQWIQSTIAFHDHLAGRELEAATAAAIARTRQHGFPAAVAADSLAQFRRFLDAQRKETNTARARKGAAGKKSLGADTEAKKSPQAKRKPRQAK